MAEGKNKDFLANISRITGWVSIATDFLVIFGMTQFDLVSFVLELTAVGTGVVAILLGQDKRKAKMGIILGGIGLGFRVFFAMF